MGNVQVGGSSSSSAPPPNQGMDPQLLAMWQQTMAQVSQTLQQQNSGSEQVLAQLVTTLQGIGERVAGPGGVPGILGGPAGLDMGAGVRLSGAKGYSAMNFLEEEFKQRAPEVWRSIEREWEKSIGADLTTRGWRVEEVFVRAPWQTFRTLIRLTWILISLYEGLRRVGDPADRASLNLEELHRVRARAALALCGAEQAALDGGVWDLAWQYVHLPEPPFSKLSKVQAEKKLSVHATGISKTYVAAGLAVLRDEAAILDRRRAQNPKGAGKGDKGKAKEGG